MSRRNSLQRPPVLLTIAGSDSSGGAGIQADLKTFTAHQCYGASIITALTAQNTKGVEDVHPTPPAFIKKQLFSVLSDMDVHGIKTGMLYDAENTHAVAESIKQFYAERRVPPIIIDPVCVSTSGHTLLVPEAIAVMTQELFPLATLITPNKSEAELLLAHLRGDGGVSTDKHTISSIDEAIDGARTLANACGVNVLLKGGHLTVAVREMSGLLARVAGKEEATKISIDWDSAGRNMEILRVMTLKPESELVVDVLHEVQTGISTVFARSRIETTSTHGTGCTLSAAIACHLARGCSILDAVRSASDYTHAAIQAAYPLGKGNGPLNHLHSISMRLLPVPTKVDPYPFTRALIRSNATIWKEYVEHPFVIQLGKGILRRENFLHFVKQDYQYLKYYARAYGLLVAKSRNFKDIKPASDTIQNVIREVSMHCGYCANELGISEIEMENTPESPATTAYGSFLLDAGLHGDEMKLLVTLAACLLGYGEVGLWLKTEAEKPNTWVVWEGNPYLRWIEDYAGAQYQNAVRSGLDLLEFAAREDPPSTKRLEEWKEVWGRCTLLEKRFWDMAMDLS